VASSNTPALRLLGVLVGIGLLFVLLVPLAVGRPDPDADAPLPANVARKPPEYGKGRAHRAERLAPPLELAKQLARPKQAPKAGEWLFEHPEDGQLVRELVAERPENGWHPGRVLYLVAVGELPEPQTALVARTGELLSRFFQTEVKVLPPLPSSLVPPEHRRTRDFGEQWQTGPILDALLTRRPDDAAGLMAITAVDLYPGPEWNFVFGEARYGERVGVMSLWRHGELSKEPSVVLSRTLGTAAHELGHMLGLQHCVAFECVMNGANSQAESDAMPLEPCPACLEKLRLRLGLDPVRRALDVEAASRDAGLPTDSFAPLFSLWREAGIVAP
jgi:archaemetzincin